VASLDLDQLMQHSQQLVVLVVEVTVVAIAPADASPILLEA
jgi:hypothetical protein